MRCQPFVVCSSETRCRPLFLSVYLFPVPCHPCLASCHMVRAEMSSLMIHTYVRAPVSIPVPALVRTSRCIDTVRWSPYAIMPCHALPYTDCLSLPLLSSLRRDRVRAMWNLSYITLLYYSLGPTSFDVGLRRIVILNDSCWRRPPKVPRLQSFGDPAGRRALPESSCRRSRVEACLFVW